MIRIVDVVPRFLRSLSFVCLAVALSLPSWGAQGLVEGRDFVSGKCYAHLTETQLVLGNAHVRRTWRIERGRLYATSFYDQDSKTEWIGAPSPLPSPAPPFAVEANAVKFRGAAGVFGPTEENSLRIELETTGTDALVDYEFQIFPDAAGMRSWIVVKGAGAESAAGDPPEKEPEADALEHLQIKSPHLRFTQVTLRDRTDQHNELVTEDEWLLHSNEAPLKLKGNLFLVENTLTGDGLIFLKEAPLPEMRPVPSPFDARVSSSSMIVREHQASVSPGHYSISFYGHGFAASGDGYRFVLLAYQGGRTGRIAALHQYQRQIRQYVPGRDGLLLSNTWGDRSRGMNLSEDFVRREIDAGKALGVDVVQIDAGWQEGKFTDESDPRALREGYWKANPQFWDTDPVRFPNGLGALAAYAHAQGMKFGLWFSPDSASDFANWRKDADTLLERERQDGIDAFKLDKFNIQSRQGEENFRSVLDRLLIASQGKLLLDLDITAETRLGYFGDIAAGPLFVENRYTDSHRYWPNQTLRNFWELSQFVDPVRLRMEFLNSDRNTALYGNDPLAPANYDPACLFAITMFGSPLGWFENSGLSPGYIHTAAPLIARWKQEREAIYRGTMLPIGDAPDGVTWTGFASIAKSRRGGYLLLFREMNKEATWTVQRTLFAPGKYRLRVLGGDGRVLQTNDGFKATIPHPLGYLWVKVEPTS
jgi:alpha-galactosidase